MQINMLNVRAHTCQMFSIVINRPTNYIFHFSFMAAVILDILSIMPLFLKPITPQDQRQL